MGQIHEHAAEYETVRRLAKMLTSAKEDYKAPESYALFTTIVCWVVQRARTPANQNGAQDNQAREVGIALQATRISDAPWSVKGLPEMTALDFFTGIRNAVAHGDGRQIRPLNENGFLTGQIVPISGKQLRLRRADMQRIGCSLAKLFCDTMAAHEQEGDLRQAAKMFNATEARQ
ncbi:hypothetical protein RAH32_18360 [Paracoccus sp. WLY502]|uniref:hypothetical protein n=1 Tax=Paracoccus yibinensis TaxID=3068891 RepID=UPI002796C374|nr:hypothetical protein [Paracoccus sp. WLY502]MDQ1902387.1 hypothetical protein [Paracoccus sp. WLY502]